jgi:hypothetical protein
MNNESESRAEYRDGNWHEKRGGCTAPGCGVRCACGDWMGCEKVEVGMKLNLTCPHLCYRYDARFPRGMHGDRHYCYNPGMVSAWCELKNKFIEECCECQKEL